MSEGKVVIRPGQRWRHYKGETYEVVGIASTESDRQQMVVYRHPGTVGSMWIRPVESFLSRIYTVEVIDGKTQVSAANRFELVEDAP